jgi:hypothetical protein
MTQLYTVNRLSDKLEKNYGIFLIIELFSIARLKAIVFYVSTTHQQSKDVHMLCRDQIFVS